MRCRSSIVPLGAWILLLRGLVCFAQSAPEIPLIFIVQEREMLATAAKRKELRLDWFMDGNLGILQNGTTSLLYGANSSKPVRVRGDVRNPLQHMEAVQILSTNDIYHYRAGGPVYRDPDTGRLLLFYHAEIHRGSFRNFYSVIGLACQSDENGLMFTDLGPIFRPGLSETRATHAVEVCGAPYVIKDGYFYVYARDAGPDGEQINLAVVRAPVDEVMKQALAGRSAEWRKYFKGAFSEPGLGGRSSALEEGNPGTRWMDVSYNTELKKFILVVAMNETPSRVRLAVTWSDDGLRWAARKSLLEEEGEIFYPSIWGGQADSRHCRNEFQVIYTFSRKGAFDRWADAEVVRRKILIRAKP